VSAPAGVLFVFAHQDDEVGALSRIAFETRAGERVWCVYLTDGGKHAQPAVRDAESLRVLARIGVDPARVGFLRDADGRIADGTLVASLERSRTMLLDWLRAAGVTPARMFTLDWEGGHHDHDATHVITLAAARTLGVADVFVYPFYNAWRRRPGWVRVCSVVPGAAPEVRRRLSLRECWRAAWTIGAYRSQRRTWFGLGPGFIVKTLARRQERLRRADPQRVLSRPHAGALLYENVFGVRGEDVLRASAPLRAEVSAQAPLETPEQRD
jgi:LmbE family N-acetylglucosaminyl deacetylase